MCSQYPLLSMSHAADSSSPSLTGWRRYTGAFAILGTLAGSAYAGAPPLPALGADLNQTSVSGISSGGFMASQLATAYSGAFVGAGIIAGGPFYCAGSIPGVPFMQNALTTCMMPVGSANAPNAEVAWKQAQELAKTGAIDAVANLRTQRVYLFSGANDPTVKTLVVDQAANYYQLAGTPDQHLKYIKNLFTGHAIMTNDEEDVPCPVTAPPFINNCGFEQSQDILRHIYGELQPPVAREELSGRILNFDQGEFVKGTRTSMSDQGFAYIPKSCETEACKVHVAIHGCLQYAENMGDKFYTGTGYNEIADTNKIIVLYPQTKVSKPMNPKGCWDFWGYSDENPKVPVFYTKDAPQMSAIMAMVRRLGEPRPPAY